jgi:hypothetical protein
VWATVRELVPPPLVVFGFDQRRNMFRPQVRRLRIHCDYASDPNSWRIFIHGYVSSVEQDGKMRKGSQDEEVNLQRGEGE